MVPVSSMAGGALSGAGRYDVYAVAAGPAVFADGVVESADEVGSLWFGGGLHDGVFAEERVAGEVHLGDQALVEGGAHDGEVDVGRAPGVASVIRAVAAGHDGGEAVPPVGVGEAAPGAGEIGVERA